VGIFSLLVYLRDRWLTPMGRVAAARREESHKRDLGDRRCRFEPMEDRRMLNAAPIHLGVIYVEDDSGNDLQGDTFEIRFEGGAAGTELTRLIINGDKNTPGLSIGDMIFDTLKSSLSSSNNGLGADEAVPLSIVSSTGIDGVSWQVEDGTSLLIFDFVGFHAGEKLVFRIDVDEIQDLPDIPPGTVFTQELVDEINDGVDPIASGVEFQGTLLTATFEAPRYHEVTGSKTFRNAYDSQFAGTSLLRQTDADGNPLSTADAHLLAPDNLFGQRDRSAGTMLPLQQVPLPVTLAGTVFHDMNLNLVQEPGEEGIAGVTLALWRKEGETYVDTLITTQTDVNGNYLFGLDLNLLPGTYQVVEAQPAGYYSVGAIPGTVESLAVGQTVPGDFDVLTEIVLPLGDQHAIDYDFAEAQPASISGYVYHDRNNNGLREPGEEGIPNVAIQVVPVTTIAPQPPIFVTTDSEGFYEAVGLVPGTYKVTEPEQPTGFFDGLDTAGTVNGIVVGAAVNPGDRIEGVFLGGNKSGIEYNFGEVRKGSIRGRVHLTDRDGNCFGATSESRPLEGVVILLKDAQGNVLAQTTTDENGQYAFLELDPGTYSVEEITPPGLIDGDEHVGTIHNVHVGLIQGNDLITNIVLGSGDDGVDYDFCEHEPASLAGFVYHDANNNGVFDSGEAPIADATVSLFGSNGAKVGETQTLADGSYLFAGLSKDVYTVVETQPQGWLDGLDAAGTINGLVVGAAVNPGDSIHSIDLGWGENGVHYDFGELLPGSIRGFVHSDPNRNCLFEEGEAPIAGVKVELLDGLGNVIDVAFTDANGAYHFDNLFPGQYSVRETQPVDYFHGGQVVGSGNGDATIADLLSSVDIASGENLIDYNFCEVPPASISGFVFIDGEPILLPAGGALPTDISSLRDGVLTPDDTRLPGVVLELRNGIDGTPIMADQALPGIYPAGPIRTTTNADGFYEFKGLRFGNYAVFQIHPGGSLFDGIDTAGTTTGIAFNPGAPVNPAFVSQLTVNPLNDAIIRIPLPPGANSQFNNFSEVRVVFPPPEEEPPPETPPPPVPPALLPPPPRFVPPPIIVIQPPDPIIGGYEDYTWHLSVVDAGRPRRAGDLFENTTLWLAGTQMAATPWSDIRLDGARWTFLVNSAGDGDAILPEVVAPRIFGMPGAVPVAGDFNCDGTSEIGVFFRGEWFIDLNGNGQWDADDLWAGLGRDADQPVVGDWDGDGKTDIAIFGPAWPGDHRAIAAEPGLPDLANPPREKPKNVPPEPHEAAYGRRTMKLTSQGQVRADLIDHVFHFGVHGDTAVVGDWNGDGVRNIGVFRAGRWHLDMDGDGRWSKADRVLSFGQPGDIPVVGDFNGNGIDQIGVYRRGTWILDANENGEMDAHDRVFELGGAEDRPVVGDWNGDGIDDFATFRPIDGQATAKSD
jgi:serine-aspartate repeat-containing protein C/D/E